MIKELSAQEIFEDHMDQNMMDNMSGDWNWIPFTFIDNNNLGLKFAEYMKDICKEYQEELLEEEE